MDLQQLDFDVELMEFDQPVEIAGFDLDWAGPSSAIDTDMTIIKRYPRPRTVKYEYSADMVKKMPDMQEGEALYAIVSGNFIFGDFIESYLVENNFMAEELHIATLSLSQDNVDSLRNIRQGGYVQDMSLIVSDYWYAHERRKKGGVPYIMEKLGAEGRFSFAAAGLHTKVTLIKTTCGRYMVLHGSANLRSSRNVEQFCVENNRELYLFNRLWMGKIMDNFKINKKTSRGGQLWQTVQEPIKKQD